MSLEEQLHIAMKHRAILAAAVVGTMESPFVSDDILRIKMAMMKLIMRMCSDDDVLRDDIELRILKSMHTHCAEQIEINELLEGINE
jgi:hypothetical protein